MSKSSPVEELSVLVVEAVRRVHRDLGPGLLESVYEAALSKVLGDAGLRVERRKAVPLEYEGLLFDEGFHVDLLVEDSLPVELKAVDELKPVHARQVLTHLRLMNLPVGYLINFETLSPDEGIRRIVNDAATPARALCRPVA